MGELDFDTVRRRPGETMTRPSQAKVNSRTMRQDRDKNCPACHFAEVGLRSAVEDEPSQALQTEIRGDGGRRNDLQCGASHPGDHER